jgi:hypothetical protein
MAACRTVARRGWLTCALTVPAAGSPPGVLATEASRADVAVPVPPAETAAMTAPVATSAVAAVVGHLRILRLRECPPTKGMILLISVDLTG